MPVFKLNIEDFLNKQSGHPLIDVRSPKEFAHAHIPGAVSIPLFDDEERAVIGTAYHQQGREQAVDIGLGYFAESMEKIRSDVMKVFAQEFSGKIPEIFVYCWRGGMRSGAVAWLLSLYGYRVYVLEGGYKSFRNWVLQKFEEDFNIRILGGFSGAGKTGILLRFKERGQKIIDLEAIAHHRGSAFGALGMPDQPSQEMFENKLAVELDKSKKSNPGEPVWLEDESRHIGKSFLPNHVWSVMRNSPFFFVDIPFETRLENITLEYGKYDDDLLISSIEKIRKRLGGDNAKNAIEAIKNQHHRDAFRILLTYYDKMYEKSLAEHRESGVEVHKISSADVDSLSVDLI